jgi:hypothetical protein
LETALSTGEAGPTGSCTETHEPDRTRPLTQRFTDSIAALIEADDTDH